jgi:hypothetical protein
VIDIVDRGDWDEVGAVGSGNGNDIESDWCDDRRRRRLGVPSVNGNGGWGTCIIEVVDGEEEDDDEGIAGGDDLGVRRQLFVRAVTCNIDGCRGDIDERVVIDDGTDGGSGSDGGVGVSTRD